MIQVLHLSSRWNSYSSPCSYKSYQIFSVSGKLSPHNVEMPSISPLQVCPSVVGVPTTPFDPSPKDAFSSSFVTEVGILFSILLFQLSIFYSFVPEASQCCSFHPSFHSVKDHVLFMPIHLTGVLCPFAQVLFALSSLASLFYRSAVRICSSLLLFSTGVPSTLFFFVVFFLSICSTSQESWFHSFVKEAT